MTMGVPVFIGIIASLSFIISQTTELRPYITKGNLSCFECPPGFYLSGDCTSNNTIAVCRVCPYGYYSSVPGVHTSCAICSPFCESANLIVVSSCSSTNNLTCDCPSGKVLKDPHDKHHAICSADTAEKHNVSIYNQTQADPGSGTVEDVDFSNLTNSTCPAQDKCVDSNNSISLSDRVIIVSLIVFNIFILCMFVICNTQCCDKLKGRCRCKGTNTDSVPDQAKEKLVKVEWNQGEEEKEESRVEIGNGTNDEQVPTNSSELTTLDNTDASHGEAVPRTPTSTTPHLTILPSATGNGNSPSVNDNERG
ncbi:uncharacterized protein LOC110460904 isoform X2 [Mizuhopecten yessoensis]|uniref:uncharacterized protein LOC110460904 isoform X2 n=1 Tax=Mizuhopecten yessoensis TaxID=6573 RepID=UPI000B45EB88|nr:uncharacterized protein LOC110460904 isoform X2 [Mizuhopecten yessoensis]